MTTESITTVREVSAPLRRIIHVDMDAFYASVEQRDDPSLRGKPVVVGGQPDQRGVVAAASYEARVFGIRSAMPMARAARLCPSLVIVRPDFHRYKTASSTIFGIFRSVTPLVEGLSLDEAYLDVTRNLWGEPLAVTVARRLKSEIRETTGLTASAGVAPNKFLAKIASGWKKPDGLTVIAPDRIDAFLQKLPIDALWGVGPVTARKLRARKIERLVDVRVVEDAVLREAVGSMAGWLRELAQGRDDRPVEPDRAAKSNGHENTYSQDLSDPVQIRAEVDRLARASVGWVVRQGLVARTVQLKVRYSNFETITRSLTRLPPTADAEEVAARALELLTRTDFTVRPVRLLGVSLQSFVNPSQVESGWLPGL